jgi:hypothetical protein
MKTRGFSKYLHVMETADMNLYSVKWLCRIALNLETNRSDFAFICYIWCSSETSVKFHATKWRYIPEDINILCIHCVVFILSEKLRS